MTTPATPGAFDAIRMQAAQIGLFETPILHGRLTGGETLTAQLAQAIRARRDAADSLARSNVGGWHSATDMLDWGGPAAAKLADFAVKTAIRMSHFDGRDARSLNWEVKMWANISPPGALNMSHAHPGVLWAAVYYVDMGTPPSGDDAGGELFFEDPRFPVPLMRMPGFRMLGIDGQPQVNERRWPTQAGDLVLFPAWLRHGVRPHAGAGERISVAMNIDVRG
ncbi:TIGR02466 family protein [Sphingomonas sp. MMS12-HWE2-04]|uniref:TIGR02466 family protein n=1 Tax=Sphingomonas sp. MMS12-HWE2-04 TaxID=3234199 RepID=UPI00384F748C